MSKEIAKEMEKPKYCGDGNYGAYAIQLQKYISYLESYHQEQMALKLDKIVEEIEEEIFNEPIGNYPTGVNDGIEKALEIINKH